MARTARLPMRQRRPRSAVIAGEQLHTIDTDRPKPPSRRVLLLRATAALVPLMVLSVVLHIVFSRHPPQEPQTPPKGRSADEDFVTTYRIPANSYTREEDESTQSQCIPTCIPTVTRADGSVEYVSNAVKSWYLAHNGAPPNLVIYDMDRVPSRRKWLQSIGEYPSWLKVQHLNAATGTPRKQTYNDSVQRVAWRSKEAQDYAAVLRACAKLTESSGDDDDDDGHILIVQDDVLFHERIRYAAKWALKAMAPGAGKKRVCSTALFDLGHGVDKMPLTSSNLVARYWRARDAAEFANYIESNFDEAPVDWLADRWCRRRGIVPVLRPSPLRHRGKVSSFVGNKRDNLLT